MRAAMRRLRWVAMGLTTTLCLVGTAAAQTENGEWRSYSGDQGSTKYAPLDQINRTNVKNLRIAWRRPAVDPLLSGKDPKLQVPNNFRATPLMIGGVLYSPNGVGLVEAFDPGTGKTIWIQEPPPGPDALRGTSTRGVAYWRDARRRTHLRAARRDADRPERKDGPAVFHIRRRGCCQSAPGFRQGAVLVEWCAPRVPGRRHRWCLDERLAAAQGGNSRRCEGLRRPHGSTPLDLSCRSARRRVWCRYVEGQLVAVHRAYESLVAHQRRRTTRIRVSAAHQSDERHVRWTSAGRQFVLGHAGQHRVPDGETRVALPTRASRLVGLRFASRADSGGHHGRWPADPVRRAADEAGVCLRLRPRHRPACLADRRSSRAAVEDTR